jgi:hypothetical protein
VKGGSGGAFLTGRDRKGGGGPCAAPRSGRSRGAWLATVAAKGRHQPRNGECERRAARLQNRGASQTAFKLESI